MDNYSNYQTYDNYSDEGFDEEEIDILDSLVTSPRIDVGEVSNGLSII